MSQGRLIGNYRLRERIGEGGMGEVYTAERENEFRQLVAIKLIRPGMASPEVVRRFLIERQTMAALSHPHIVRLVDGGTTEDGLPYLVVDYVEGGVPIDRYCRDRKLTVADRLRLFLEVCAAVHYAHQSLVVHCDLKPSNILVTAEGVPMLLDFGIAKLLDPISIGITADAAKTRQRAFTPDYASPEQLRGQPVSTATDVYALGVILYELLAGRSPYAADASASLADWIRSVCEEDVAPPSKGSSRNADLDAIALKALRKDPRDRYSSVDQMAADIRRHLAGEPVLARKNTTPYLTRKFVERHKLGVAAAALALIALAAGVGSTLWESRLAARRFDDVRHLAHTFLFDVHDSIQYLPGSTPARALIARIGTQYLDELARDSRGDASLQLEVADGYLKIGDVQGNPFLANLGARSKAIESYNKALAIAEAAAARNAKDWKAKQVLARTHLDLAAVLPYDGKLDQALEHTRQALRLYQENFAAQPGSIEAQLDVSHGYEVLGDILGGANQTNLGRKKEAEEFYRQSLALLPRLPPESPFAVRAARGRAVMLAKLGDMKKKAGDLSGALAHYQDSLAATNDLIRADPNNVRLRDIVSVVLNKIGSVYTVRSDSAHAIESYRQAIAVDDEILKLDPNNDKARSGLMISEKNLGDMYFYILVKIPDALECYRRATDVLETQLRADPGNVVLRRYLAEVISYVASCLYMSHQLDEARRQAQRSLVMAKELADRPGAAQDLVYSYAFMAATIEPPELRRPAEILPYAVKAVKMSGESDIYSLHVLAQVYDQLGDCAHVIQADRKALSLLPPVEPGKPKPVYQTTIENMLKSCHAEPIKR